MKKPLNICVLSNSPQTKLIETIMKRGHNPTLLNPENLILYISDRPHGYDELWRDGGARITSTEFDACIPRIHTDRYHSTRIIDHLNKHLGVWTAQTGDSINFVTDKIICAQMLSRAKIRTPKQILARSPKDLKFLISKVGGLPCVLKGCTGTQGKGIILLESIQQSNMLLESFYLEQRNFLIQQFIDNGGQDLRLIVIGSKVVSCMKRIAPPDDIRSNRSLRGMCEKFEPDEETKQMAVDAVAAIPGLGWAGVDLMLENVKDDQGNNVTIRYLIEENSASGEGIITITNYNHYEDLIDFVENNYNKK
jgi:ribosomal protein S6--L-glutamate ligase